MTGIGAGAGSDDRVLSGTKTRGAPGRRRGARGSSDDGEGGGAVHRGRATLAAEDFEVLAGGGKTLELQIAAALEL